MESKYEDFESSYDFEDIDQFLNGINVPTQFHYGYKIQYQTSKKKGVTKAEIIELATRKKQLWKKYNYIKASRISNSHLFYCQSSITFKSSEKTHQILMNSINIYHSLKKSITSLKETIQNLKRQIDQQKLQQSFLKSDLHNQDLYFHDYYSYYSDDCLRFKEDNSFSSQDILLHNIDKSINPSHLSSLEKELFSIQAQNMKNIENLQDSNELQQKEAISSIRNLSEIQLKHFQLKSQIEQIKCQNSQISYQIEQSENNIHNLSKDIMLLKLHHHNEDLLQFTQKSVDQTDDSLNNDINQSKSKNSEYTDKIIDEYKEMKELIKKKNNLKNEIQKMKIKFNLLQHAYKIRKIAIYEEISYLTSTFNKKHEI